MQVGIRCSSHLIGIGPGEPFLSLTGIEEFTAHQTFFFHLSECGEKGKACPSVQEKKEQIVQYLVPFCRSLSSSFLFLDAFCSCQVNQVFKIWVFWIDETHIFLLQQLRTESAQQPPLFLFSGTYFDLQLIFQTRFFWFPGRKVTSCCLFFPSSLPSENNSIRMTNSYIWNAYSCFLCCSVRKKVNF